LTDTRTENPVEAKPATPEASVDRYDMVTMRSIEGERALSTQTGIPRALFIPQTYGEALEIAKMMCAGIGVPAYLRGSPANCMAVLMQASRWGLDPYAVASKSYFVNDMIAYEAQLVNAVVNTSGALVGRLKIWWEGQDNGLRCFVEGQVKGETETALLSQSIARVKVKNSPLWQVNPEQQLAYLTSRAWARLYIPEVLLGVYTPDEIIDGGVTRAVSQQRPVDPDATPKTAPRREDYVHLDREQEQEQPRQHRSAKVIVTDEVDNYDRGGEQQGPQQEEQQQEPVERVVGPVPEGFETWNAWADTVATRMKTAATLPKLDAVTRDTNAIFVQAPDDVRTRLVDLYEEKAADHRAAAQ
jgi:hypothetical protein